MMIKAIDSLIRSSLPLYIQVRRFAAFLCRYLLLEEGFSVLRYVNPIVDSVAIDVGSNDGTSIEMILQLHPKSQIHSFDPVISPTKVHPQVLFHNVALADERGELVIHVPLVKGRLLTQYSSNNRARVTSQLMGDFNIDEAHVTFSTITCESLSLDSLDLNPYFLKIDVEGQEASVLQGSLKTVAASRPIVLIEIQSWENYELIENIFNGIGYFHLQWPQRQRRKDFGLRGNYSHKKNNYLWLPKTSSPNWKIVLAK